MADSTVKFKADISQLKAEMQAASRAVKLANSEFKKATAGMDDWSSSADGLQAKIKQLNSTLEAQKKRVELANKEYEKTAQVYGENSAEADRAKISLNNYIAAMEKTEKELVQYEKELEDCEEGTGKFADATDELDDATSKAADGFTVMKGALADLVADGIRMAISAIKDLATETMTVGMNFESAMSKVGAVSGASAEEIDLLTQKAKEMGETTIFSASESAEAFNYMAMAGWKTEDMLNGIEGIMNLAAASGSDLATTSDIVTDALTAMGYGAEDAGRLADVMAAASSNANTNVEMMGQTFQYAAPIIGALGMNMEDAAVAIGLMANAGIKGEKSGTALRSILTRLSAPPKECAEAMDELGISLTDQNGKMKSMDDVMNDLRKAFSGLSETQQTANAKAIAGQEAMSGLLAIVNAAPADIEKLTTAVNNSSGAAKSMADTMNDNVGGALTLLKSNIEGKMITVYENASESIKEAIGTISDALNGVDWESFGRGVGKAVKKVVDLFTGIVKHAEDIITVLKSVGTVLIATFVVTKLLTFVSTIMTMVETFKTLKVAVEGATAAQKLLNIAMAATPIGVAAAAITGLAAGLLMVAANSKEAVDATNSLTDAEKAQIDAIHEANQAAQETFNQRNENVAGIQSEYAYYQSLADELKKLAGEHGKVSDAEREHAQTIIDTLNTALGTEIEMNDGVIQKYESVLSTIDKVIEKKKAEAILSANQEAYAEAIQNQDKAAAAYADTLNMFNEVSARRNQAEAEMNRLSKLNADQYAQEAGIVGDLHAKEQALEQAKQEAIDIYNEEQRAVYESRQALNEAKETYSAYAAEIENYNGLNSALISGDSEKISEALNKLSNDFQTAETATSETLKKQYENYDKSYKSMKDAVEKGGAKISKQELENAKKLRDDAKKEYEKSGQDNADGYAKGIEENASKAGQASRDMGNESVDELRSSIGAHSPATKTITAGENFGQGFINGMNNKESLIYKKAFELGKKAVEALKKAQQEGSPSKLTYQSGVYFVQGYINGIYSMKNKLVATVAGTVKSVVKELKKMSDGNYQTVAQNAANKFSSVFASTLQYNLNKMAYQNERKLKEFDNEITKLQNEQQAKTDQMQAESDAKVNALQKQYDNEKDKNKKNQLKTQIDAEKDAVKKQIEATKKNYEALIKQQQAAKSNYQKASQEMINAYTQAMNDYQQQAQELIESTINGITDKYQAKYDDLIDKQNTLVDKLKSTGDLFEISGAGVMTISDLKEQTKEINAYTKQLQTLKGKVSEDLFNQIASYDMKEGSAFMKQLLSMSDKDLEAYNKAYTQKITAATKAGDKIYKKDINNLSKEYKSEVTKAFEGIDEQLKKMGNDAVKSFLSAFKTNTNYMTKQIKEFVSDMSTAFRDAIYDSENSKNVSFITNGIGSAKQAAGTLYDNTAYESGSRTTNNYYLTQNNTSPKALTALQTYQAQRQQLALLQAATS